MIFAKGEETGKDILELKIDGIAYPMAVSVNTDHLNCKASFLDFMLEIERLEDDGEQAENLASWKKDVISRLKDFEKKYVKHAKSVNKDLYEI